VIHLVCKNYIFYVLNKTEFVLERCRDTLLHELCHAAVSLIDNVMDEGHGPLWRKWTRKAERCYPYLPAISVKHTYDIAYKFIYRCIKCHYE